MKIILTILLVVTSILFYSFGKEQITCSGVIPYSSENHKYSGIPPAGKTGAPGEGLCFNCHSLSTLNDTLGSVSMNFNGGVNFYMPDSTYLISIKVKQTGNTVFGFETTVLDSSTIKAGSFIIRDSATTAYQTLAGREYLSHQNVISNMSNDSLEWSFNWKAPSSNLGCITLYFVGVSNSTFISIAAGNVYNDSLKICPDPSIVGVNEASNFTSQISVYPNPTQDKITLQFSEVVQNQSIKIYNAIGKMVLENIVNGVKKVTISVKHLPSGIYYIASNSNGTTHTNKLIITN